MSVLQNPWRNSEVGGRLDHLITLQSKSSTPDAGGGRVDVYTSVVDVWASRQVLDGNETQEADQKLALGGMGFRIRWGQSVTAQWRVICEGVTYEIIAPPQDVGRQQFTDLICRALNPGE